MTGQSSTAATPIPQDYQGIVAALRGRASRLKTAALFIMIIIVGLLGLGALSFLYAREIAQWQFPTDYQGKLDALYKKDTVDDAKVGEINGRIGQNTRLVANALAGFNKASTNPNSFSTANSRVTIASDAFCDTQKWHSVFTNLPQRSGGLNRVTISNFGYDFDIKDADAIESAIRAINCVAITPDEYSFVLQPQYFITERNAEKQLREIINARKVEQITGIPVSTANMTEADQAVTLPRVLNENLSRFGPIILITFLVSILTPLYRYNVRLAAYYDGRADALTLLATPLKSNGFIRLAGALSPSLDFGKAPQTPIDQAIEIARLIVGKQKGEETE